MKAEEGQHQKVVVERVNNEIKRRANGFGYFSSDAAADTRMQK